MYYLYILYIVLDYIYMHTYIYIYIHTYIYIHIYIYIYIYIHIHPYIHIFFPSRNDVHILKDRAGLMSLRTQEARHQGAGFEGAEDDAVFGDGSKPMNLPIDLGIKQNQKN